MKVHFASGLIVETDALIGADGLNSRVRSQLDDTYPIYRGCTAWRGLTNYVRKTLDLLHEYICTALPEILVKIEAI